MATENDDIGDLAGTINKSMIAETIGRWMRGTYVTVDTRYEARDRRGPGMMQRHGECMMDPDLPATAVAMVFMFDDDSIHGVRHTRVFG